MRVPCVTPHTFENTKGVAIIEVRRARSTEQKLENAVAVVLKLCVTVHVIHSSYSGAIAHTVRSVGDEYKTGEGTGTTRHDFKPHTILRRCGHIPSNPSLLAATSMVNEQSGRGQKLKLGHGAHVLLHCSTPHGYRALFNTKYTKPNNIQRT